MDGNLDALNKYEVRCEIAEEDYNYMLDAMREAEPEDYNRIMEEYGFGDVDLAEVIGDL